MLRRENLLRNDQNHNWPRFALSALAICTWLVGMSVFADDWAQWRGPNRDGISQETGWLKDWPSEGLKELWRVPLGDGYSGISVVGERVYTMADEGEEEFAFCLDATTGDVVWRFKTAAKFINDRGDGPRSAPTIDGERVFVLSASGKLYALNSKTGERLWMRDFVKEFGSKAPGWGFSTSAIIEGDLLITEVGGRDRQSIVGFNKTNGEVVWATHTDEAGYSSPIAITFNGKRQVVFLTPRTLISVNPTDGHVYWKYSWPEGINIATPIFIPPDKLFISASYDKGAVMVSMKADGEKIAVEEMWKNRLMRNHFNASVLLGDYLYGFDNATLKCIRVDTGEEQWVERGLGKGSLVLTDGHLIVLGEQGTLALVEASPTAYNEKARYELFDSLTWTVPTLSSRKLYVRNQEELVCLDMSQK